MIRMLSLLAAVSAALTLSAQRPEPIPNSIKYRDAGVKPSKGSAGSASVEALALLGRDGTVTAEVTTGTFDDVNGGRGSIDKVQVKVTRNGETLAKNFNGLSGGYVAVPVTGLAYGQAVELLTHVSGIDGSRVDVVPASATVKRRPDLFVIVQMAHALRGEPSTIEAAVVNRSGDTGARGNCVLYVDGVESDRANDIWVEPSTEVTCSFTHTFDTGGSHQLRVDVEDQRPSDWDTADNSGEKTILVYDSADEVPLWAADSYVNTSESHNVFESAGEANDTYENGWSSNTNFDAWVTESVDFEAVQLSYTESSEGTIMTDRPGLFVEPASYWSPNCRTIFADSLHGEVCRYGAGVRINLRRGSSVVRYISRGRGRDWWTGDYYVWNYDQTQTLGGGVQPGNSVDLTVRLSDGTTLWEATPHVDMNEQTEAHWDVPWHCDYDWWYGDYCQSYKGDSYARRGYARNF